MGWAVQQQAAQQPGHQPVAGQYHGDAQYVVSQRRRLMFGNRDHGHQRQYHQAKLAYPALQEFDLGPFPAKVQLRHAARREDAVGGVEHQPGLGDLQQGRAQVGVLPAGVDLQRVAAQRQAQGHGHRQQDVDQDGLRRMPLAVALEVADVLVNLFQAHIQRIAPPQQRADQQQQRQEQQRALGQAVIQLADAGRPGQGGDLLAQVRRYGFQPFGVQRLVAGDPEHLLVERGAQGAGGAEQLFLVQLQGDGFVEQCAQFAAQAFQQVAAGDRHFQQGAAQLRGDFIWRLVGQQVVHIGAGGGDQLSLLVDLELVQANVGDVVGQVFVHGQTRQGLLLFIENLGQQQAALEHVDLLVQGRIALGHGVQLLLGLQVFLGQVVEAVGAFEQVVGQLEVVCAFLGQDAAAAGFLRFDGLLGHRLLGLGQAFLVDQGLQVLDFLFQARGFFLDQVMLAVAQVLQLAVAGQFLAAQGNQGIQGRQFGVELVALIAAEGLAVVFAELERRVDLLDARLAAADFGLGTLGAGLGGDGQAVGVGQLFLQVALLGAALHQQLLKLRHRQAGVALGHRDDFGGLEARQLTLVLIGLARGLFQLALEVGQALLVVLLIAQVGQGLLQGRLQRLHVGVRQLAVGQFIQALLDGFGAGRVGGIYAANTKGQAQQGSGEKSTQGWHRDRSCKVKNRGVVVPQFRGRVRGPGDFLRGI